MTMCSFQGFRSDRIVTGLAICSFLVAPIITKLLIQPRLVWHNLSHTPQHVFSDINVIIG